MPCNGILIVEDEEDARDTLKLLLELEGFEVIAAENGQEGLRRLSEHPQPCLIFLDLMMPVMNGWEFLEALSTDHRPVLATTPIVVVSAAADVGEQPGKLGCLFMNKPFDTEPLLQLVREHCSAEG